MINLCFTLKIIILSPFIHTWITQNITYTLRNRKNAHSIEIDSPKRKKNSAVIISGNTNTAFDGALATVKLHTSMSHQWRRRWSYDKRMPKDLIRRIIDLIACILQIPCITIREDTERQETINLGANILVPASETDILSAVDFIVKNHEHGRIHLANQGPVNV